ncbi:DUF551 domain-containing protein [Escherichia coli]|nr:DUF551 domain-containing protein [Escherichia coli]EJA8320246.1 DUF551 domain-containing protein [Escherichia coli]
MTTITKERLLTIKQWRETYGPGSNVVLPAEEAEELARIALASLEAEPIGFRCRRNDNLGDWSYVYHREPDDFERKHLVIEGIYAAPPAPVVPEEMYWQDAPVEGSSKAAAYATGWNDCREAMLQSGNFRENKDSSTNNFRKIPEASTSSPVTPALLPGGFTIEEAKELHEDLVRSHISKALSGEKMKKKDRDADLRWIHGVIVQAAWFVKASLEQNALSGNSPVTPDGWISCSERIPDDKQYVWCWGKSYGWTECDTFEGYYDWSRNKWWAVTDDGEEPASKVTHWIPLPEPPQEVK